jgi:hypothetical protein
MVQVLFPGVGNKRIILGGDILGKLRKSGITAAFPCGQQGILKGDKTQAPFSQGMLCLKGHALIIPEINPQDRNALVLERLLRGRDDAVDLLN